MGYPLISKVCDEMRNFHYEGNIVPISWCRKLKKIVWDREAHEYRESDQTDHLAILILSDILYWYRPIEVRDERSGQLIGYNQKFKGDKLQKTYQEYAELFNAPKSTVKRAIDNLVFRGLVKREFRVIKTDNGIAMCNVMYLEPVLDEIKKITYPRNDMELSSNQTRGYGLVRQEDNLKSDLGITPNQTEGYGKARQEDMSGSHTGTNTYNTTQNTTENTTQTSTQISTQNTNNSDKNNTHPSSNIGYSYNYSTGEEKNNTSISSPYGEEILSSNPNSFSSSNGDSLSNCENSSFRAGCCFNNNNTPRANRFSSNKESVFFNTSGEYIYNTPAGNNNSSLDERDSFRESEFSTTTGGKYIPGSNNNNTPSAKKNSLSKEGVSLDAGSNNNQTKGKSTNNGDSNIPTESDNNNPPVEDTPSSEKTKKTGRSRKDHIPYEEIINYLNEKTGKHFKASTRATRRLIHARWNEGFRLEDFKQVIDNKVADWKDNPEMSKYLRPQTLFSPKFEAYLNQTPPAQKNQPAPADGVPYEEIVSLYNRILPELPPAKVLNEKRKRLIAERWLEDPERQNLFWWENFFRHVRKSGFLMGLVIRKGQKPFKADLDWLLQEDHFIHVLEGRYHGPIAGVDIGEKALLTIKAAESLSREAGDEEPQERLY